MPPPTSYSEPGLAAWMHRQLGDTAATLGWSLGDVLYDEAVYATLRAYGELLIADATDMAKLEALALREVWRTAVNATGGEHTYQSGTESFTRSDIAKNAERRFALADADARPYDRRFATAVTQLHPADNPYRYLPDALRVLS